MISIPDCIVQIKKIINDYTNTGENDSFDVDINDVLKAFITTAANHIATVVPPELVAVTETKTYTVQDNRRPDQRYYKIIKDIAFRKLVSITAITTIHEEPVALQQDGAAAAAITQTQWVKTITNFKPFSSNDYQAQFTDVPGIGNGPASPAAFMTPGSAGATDVNPTIEIHAFDSDDDLTVNITYIPTSFITSDNVTVNEALTDTIIYMSAALYLQSISDERAQAMMSTANTLLQSFTNNNNEQ